jgi:hypothetical protein
MMVPSNPTRRTDLARAQLATSSSSNPFSPGRNEYNNGSSPRPLSAPYSSSGGETMPVAATPYFPQAQQHQQHQAQPVARFASQGQFGGMPPAQMMHAGASDRQWMPTGPPPGQQGGMGGGPPPSLAYGVPSLPVAPGMGMQYPQRQSIQSESKKIAALFWFPLHISIEKRKLRAQSKANQPLYSLLYYVQCTLHEATVHSTFSIRAQLLKHVFLTSRCQGRICQFSSGRQGVP